MIPIRLELQAFMPFKEKTILDFNAIQTDRIFLISGKTGSGKTALFDAVCFALYGTPSGSERNSDDLKSQFAGDEIESYVDFTFQNKGKVYQIRRTPVQNRLRRNGNVSVESASAVLTLENGEILSRISEVNEKIEEILGLTVSQFKKIVMLPQGEFRKFLSDPSKEKQEILRKIFGTEIYDQFTDQLRICYNELFSQIKTTNTKLASYVSQISADQDDELKEAIVSEYKNYPDIIQRISKHNQSLLQQVQTHKNELSSLQEQDSKLDLSAAEELNQKFIQLEQHKQEYQKLIDCSSKMEQEKQTIASLEQIKESKHLFDLRQQQENKQKQLQLNLSLQRKQYKEAEEEYHRLELQYQTELDFQKQAPQIIQQINQANQDLLLFAELAKEEKVCQKTKREIAQLDLQHRIFKLEQTQKDTTNLIELTNAALSAVQTTQKADREFLIQSEQYEKAFRQFLSGQAYQLSLQLSEHTPCPVCGSLAHPSPAEPTDSIKEEDLSQKKECYENAAQRLKNAKLQMEISIEKIKNSGLSLPVPAESPYIQLCETFSSQLTELFEKQNEISAQLDELKEKSTDQYSRLEESDFSRKRGELNAIRNTAEDKIRSIREIISQSQLDEQTLKGQILSHTQKLEYHQTAFTTVSQKRSEIQTKKDQTAKTIELEQQQESEISAQIKTLSKQCSAVIRKLKKTPEEFIVLLSSLDTLPQRKETVQQWEQTCLIKKERILTYTKELQGKTPADTDTIKREKKQLKEKITMLSEQVQTLMNQYHLNYKMHQELIREYQKNEQLSKQYDEISLLYQTASGKNKDRISFERYVLGIYFDQVIQSANIRLDQMTNSRYFLRRRDGREKGNASSGLELEIFDSYNGKFRHVNTLSGGESFKTALSLALGLADVITQKSGGIEINTIFIDEGFGTLDEEALDSAIDCLFQIKESGRYIGIISHVSELKEKIPVKLKVFQSKEGSSAQFETDRN